LAALLAFCENTFVATKELAVKRANAANATIAVVNTILL
jgi:hypothetical protein